MQKPAVVSIPLSGKILMQDKKVPGEEEIMEHKAELAYKLVREP